MTFPQRIQLRRTKGWRKPEGAIVVARPTRLGNPFQIDLNRVWFVRDDNGVPYEVPGDTREAARAKAVELFREDLTHWLGGRITNEPGLREAIEGLRGHDLACWCPLDSPCHADLLLELANGGERR